MKAEVPRGVELSGDKVIHNKQESRIHRALKLAVLVSFAVVVFLAIAPGGSRTEDARLQDAKLAIASTSMALNFVKSDTGKYPTTSEGLNALSTPPAGAVNWHGPYLESEMRNDPWGHAYIYRFPGSRNPDRFDLLSLGPDGKAGTNDDIVAP